MKILILEDNPIDADLCRRAISSAIPGCIIDLAPDIAGARKLIGSDVRYDLALLDVNLPDGNGLELLTEIRENSLDIAVVIFTDQGNEELAISALKAGADDYIAKKQGFTSELPHIIPHAISSFKQSQKQKTEVIRIIYIEHNPMDVDLTLRHLRKFAPNIRVEVLSSAEEALNILPASWSGMPELNYQLILLDYRLPGMSAFDFIKTIRQERMIDIPIIIVTGQGDEDIAVQALKLGVSNFISKNENYLFKLPLLIKDAYQQLELTRKQAELAASESKYRLLAENSGDVIFTLDKDLKFSYSSPAIKHLRGYEPEELLSRHISEILTPESYSKAEGITEDYSLSLSDIEREITPERILELEMTRRDGSTVWTEVKTTLIFDENGAVSGIVGVARDITDRRRAMEELRKLSRAVDQSPESIIITNTLGDIEFCNPAVSEVTGYTREELLGRNSRIFKSGHTSKEEYKFIWDTIASGSIWSGEFRNKKKSGELYWESVSITPVSGNSGNITHYLAIKKDITDQKRLMAELIEAKERAQESDRLKSAFLANMSHEIRTPMNGIMGFAELLKEPNLTGEEQQGYIRIIEKSGTRMLNIINDIISISKIEAGLAVVNIMEININEQIENIYDSFKPDADAKGVSISINNYLPLNEAVIRTDKDKFSGILMSLVKNAIKYSENGNVEVGYVLRNDSGSKYLEFFVKDDGIGIPADRLDEVFKRFIQADIYDKMAYQGAGLGLAISKAYVEMLGGRIWAESEEGKGSVFYFTLPFQG